MLVKFYTMRCDDYGKSEIFSGIFRQILEEQSNMKLCNFPGKDMAELILEADVRDIGWPEGRFILDPVGSETNKKEDKVMVCVQAGNIDDWPGNRLKGQSFFSFNSGEKKFLVRTKRISGDFELSFSFYLEYKGNGKFEPACEETSRLMGGDID